MTKILQQVIPCDNLLYPPSRQIGLPFNSIKLVAISEHLFYVFLQFYMAPVKPVFWPFTVETDQEELILPRSQLVTKFRYSFVFCFFPPKFLYLLLFMQYHAFCIMNILVIAAGPGVPEHKGGQRENVVGRHIKSTLTTIALRAICKPFFSTEKSVSLFWTLRYCLDIS